jgi:hypothetical protein
MADGAWSGAGGGHVGNTGCGVARLVIWNRSVALTWVMFQSHRAGKMRTNGIFLFLRRLLDPEINRFKKYR